MTGSQSLKMMKVCCAAFEVTSMFASFNLLYQTATDIFTAEFCHRGLSQVRRRLTEAEMALNACAKVRGCGPKSYRNGKGSIIYTSSIKIPPISDLIFIPRDVNGFAYSWRPSDSRGLAGEESLQSISAGPSPQVKPRPRPRPLNFVLPSIKSSSQEQEKVENLELATGNNTGRHSSTEVAEGWGANSSTAENVRMEPSGETEHENHSMSLPPESARRVDQFQEEQSNTRETKGFKGTKRTRGQGENSVTELRRSRRIRPTE